MPADTYPTPMPGHRAEGASTPPGEKPRVGIIMGSRSDWVTLQHAADILNELGVPMTSPRNPSALYRMLLALGIVVLGLWAFALKRQEWSEHRRNHILLGTFFAVVVILFIRFNMQYFQGQARYLFPAITVIGVGVGVATLNLARGRWWAALAVVVAILGGLNLYALSRLPEEFKKRTSIPVAQIQTERPQTNVLSGNAGETPRV